MRPRTVSLCPFCEITSGPKLVHLGALSALGIKTALKIMAIKKTSQTDGKRSRATYMWLCPLPRVWPGDSSSSRD